MRISDWSSDVCSSDLRGRERPKAVPSYRQPPRAPLEQVCGMVVFPDQALRTFIDCSILTMDGRRETPVREPSADRAKGYPVYRGFALGENPAFSCTVLCPTLTRHPDQSARGIGHSTPPPPHRAPPLAR